MDDNSKRLARIAKIKKMRIQKRNKNRRPKLDVVEKYHKKFKAYENKHKGEVCYIFGCGPTVNDFKPVEDGVYIGVNRILQKKEIRDKLKYYWFGHKYWMDTINRSNGTCHKKMVDELPYSIEKFCMGTVQGKWHEAYNFSDTLEQINQLTKINAFPCDLCLNTFHKDLSTNPILGHSSVFPATQFALYAGFKKIYLVGCDAFVAPVKEWTAHKGKAVNQYDEFWMLSKLKGKNDPHLLEWWKKIYSFKNKNYPDVKMININPKGLKNLMDEDIYTK